MESLTYNGVIINQYDTDHVSNCSFLACSLLILGINHGINRAERLQCSCPPLAHSQYRACHPAASPARSYPQAQNGVNCCLFVGPHFPDRSHTHRPVPRGSPIAPLPAASSRWCVPSHVYVHSSRLPVRYGRVLFRSELTARESAV